MRVLVACEFSGTVRDAFAARGHDSWSCDLLPSESPGNHVCGDVRTLLEEEGWDLMIAHPPCTYLANSGVQYLHKRPERWKQMEEARRFFMDLLDAPVPKIAVENPLPHHFAELPPYDQIIHPFMFGDEALKRTCLWLRGLQPLIHRKEDELFGPCTHVGSGERYIGKDGKPNGSKWYQLAPFQEDRWKVRSRTFPGIARAMAEQWGGDASHLSNVVAHTVDRETK